MGIHLPIFLFLPYRINDNRRRFYNSPCIFSCFALWKNTSYPYNHAPFFHRNQDMLPHPCKLLPARQSVFRKPYIYTVKKAFFFTSKINHPFIILVKMSFGKCFLSFYKIALPSKKLSKKPPTSTPVFSKHPTSCCGVAT